MLRMGSRVSPMITAASPITMVPMPIDTSAPPCDCANSAPASATMPLDSASANSDSRSVDTPSARAIRALPPVARMAGPASDPK